MTGYLENVSILIVDDQDFIRSLIRQILKALGCTKIKDASNGRQAWDMAAVLNPDIIITDWEMEHMSGLELTQRLRTDPKSPAPYVPIIMMTGYGEIERVVEARDHGVNEYVIKPVSAKSMFSRIHSIIENPRSFVRTECYFGPDRRRRSVLTPDNRRRPVQALKPNKAVEGNQRTEERNSGLLQAAGQSVAP